MSELNNAEFYARREHQERLLARQAISPGIRAIHLELAESYAALTVRAQRTPAPERMRLVL